MNCKECSKPITRSSLSGLCNHCCKLGTREIKYSEVLFVRELGNCHICTSHINRVDGYPTIKINGKQLKIFRYLYEKENGKIPDGLHARHRCDQKACINPEHLEPGTHAENMRDASVRKVMKGNMINESDVIEIRERINSGEKLHLIAKDYKVTTASIRNIKTGKSYSYVKDIDEDENIDFLNLAGRHKKQLNGNIKTGDGWI